MDRPTPHAGGRCPVGVLGCGLLGSAVARTLVAAGTPVSVWNRTPRAAALLAAAGATPCGTVGELVRSSELILVTLADYAAAREVLADAGPLAPRTVAVITTGVPHDAERLARAVAGQGGRSLDVALLGYPADLGEPGTMLAVAGPLELWRRFEPLFRSLGGDSRHVSEDIAGASVLDVAATGAFYTVAYGAMVEAAGYARARGLDPHALIPAAEAWISILRRNLQEVADAVASGDHHSDQATVATYLEAARAWHRELAETGLAARLLAAQERNLEAASAQGLGPLGFSAQSLSMGGAAPPQR
ncbi:MAG TPA: NAD(P)-binding domain-containing protein [Solirubrobacteraceae bacterium]|nr:NAD(P)-binding domain-containing protein [Solirubrobacteraceae bacterium]